MSNTSNLNTTISAQNNITLSGIDTAITSVVSVDTITSDQFSSKIYPELLDQRIITVEDALKLGGIAANALFRMFSQKKSRC